MWLAACQSPIAFRRIGRQHRFVEEKAGPLPGLRAIGSRAAHELPLTLGRFDQHGRAETGHDFAPVEDLIYELF